MVTVRAKSTLKLQTTKSNIDYEYCAGSSVDELAKDILHAVVCNKGTVKAKTFLDDLLSNYKPDFEGL